MKIPIALVTTVATTLLLVLGSLASTKIVFAQNLESDSYIIQFGNFNVTSGAKGSASYNLTDTVGQVGSGPYSSTSYFVGAGFQYIYQIGEFSFSLSKTLIDFGELIIGIHSTDSHTINISTKGAGGYSVYAYELHPLRHQNGIIDIPNTTCDNNDCDHINAATWVNESIPGFGYNMSGDDVPSEFVSGDFFKSFADDEASEDMQVVMSSNDIANQREATTLYKAGIDSNQAAGQYETAVVFVAVPGY
jgi:hypothetical protein